MRSKLEKRSYISVSKFSADFGTVFSSAIGLPMMVTSSDVQAQIHGTTFAKDLSSEQKDRRKLAKRIVKAVQYALEDATRNESELCRKPFEKELRELDLLLENSILSRRYSITGSLAEDVSDDEVGGTQSLRNGREVAMAMTNGEITDDKNIVEDMGEDTRNPQDKGRSAVADVISDSLQEQLQVHAASTSSGSNSEIAAFGEIQGSTFGVETKSSTPRVGRRGSDVADASAPMVNGIGATASNDKDLTAMIDAKESSHLSTAMPSVAPTPPFNSEEDPSALLSHGGIPWYMDPFDPVGTTIHEERWTGRDVVRGMSEELSDMDEEELQGLVDEGMADAAQEDAGGSSVGSLANAALPARRKSGAKRRKWRGFR